MLCTLTKLHLNISQIHPPLHREQRRDQIQTYHLGQCLTNHLTTTPLLENTSTHTQQLKCQLIISILLQPYITVVQAKLLVKYTSACMGITIFRSVCHIKTHVSIMEILCLRQQPTRAMYSFQTTMLRLLID